jgi:poly(3-hydroxybutyrate) depolymerase
MRLLVLALALSAATSALAVDSRPARDMPVLNPNATAPATCPPTSRYEAARRGGKLGLSLLNELPTADMYKAVYRRIDGCEAPIIVRYDVGGNSANGRR